MTRPLTVTINGLPYAVWTQSEFQFTSVMGQTIPTMKGMLYDKNCDLAIPPLESEVIINDGFTGSRLWGGLLSMRTGTTENISRYWEIQAQGWAILLQRTLAYNSYPPGYTYTSNLGQALKGDLAILANLFEKSIVGEGGSQNTPYEIVIYYPYCQQGTTLLSTNDFIYAYLQEAVQYFTGLVGFNYHVDENKFLHYYYIPNNPATFALSSPDYGTTYKGLPVVPYHNFKWKVDGTRLINNFLVFGASVTSGTQIAYLAGDGAKLILNTSIVSPNYPISGPPGSYTLQVSVNTGTSLSPVWTPQIVGITGFDTLGVYSAGAGGVVQCMFDGASQLLTFASAPPNFTNAVKIQYVFTYQGGQPWANHASIVQYGKTFSRRIVAGDATSAANVQSQVNHLDQQFSQPVQILTLSVADSDFPSGNYNRFQVGQLVPFHNKTQGITDNFYIHSITTKVLGGEIRNYDLELRSITLE